MNDSKGFKNVNFQKLPFLPSLFAGLIITTVPSNLLNKEN